MLNKPLCVCFVLCLSTVSAAAPSMEAPSSLQDKVDAAFKAGRAADAAGLLQQEADRGNPEAQYGLGVLYEKGLPDAKIPRDASQAFHWYSLSAQSGYAPSQNNLGFLYYTGRGTPKSEAEALRWYEKASQQGNSMAQYNLGAMYFHGHEVAKDLKKALELYKLFRSLTEEFVGLPLSTEKALEAYWWVRRISCRNCPRNCPQEFCPICRPKKAI